MGAGVGCERSLHFENNELRPGHKTARFGSSDCTSPLPLEKFGVFDSPEEDAWWAAYGGAGILSEN